MQKNLYLNQEFTKFINNENFEFDRSKILKILNSDLLEDAYKTISKWQKYQPTPLESLNKLSKELKLKKNFMPEIIFIDYLNICASSRMKSMGGSINSYTYIKAIAEEMRGLAVEFNLPIMSATQTTRSGYSNDDIGLEDTSESFGLPATADLMFALISNDELANQNQIMVKQLKNRYNDPVTNQRFTIGVNRSKMRLYDIDNSISVLRKPEDDTGPVFDNTTSGQRIQSEKKKFSNFKI